MGRAWSVRRDPLGRTRRESDPVRRGRARLWLARGAGARPGPGGGGGLSYVLIRIALYLAALIPYVLLYSTKERALLIGPPIGVIGAAVTWFLLRDVDVTQARRLVHAAVVGALLFELTWAFGYWTVAPVVGGAAIWLAFYVLSGVAEQNAAGTLDRRVGIEYAVVALVGVLVVLASAPWQP